MYVTNFFTFGQGHMTSWPMPAGGGRLADYFVEVILPEDHPLTHREVFIDTFASVYCPRDSQWSMQYDAQRFDASYFPRGRLCRITEDGIEK